MRDYKVTRKDVAEGFGYSYWLKAAVIESSKRDIVDALRDAEILASILRQELLAMTGKEAR